MFHTLRSTLVRQAPGILKVPAQLVPFSVRQKVMLETLKRVYHEALDDGDFEFLEGRWLEVNVRDLGIKSYISYENEKLVVAERIAEPDVVFSAGLNDLILIAARKEDPDTLFFQRRLSIEGDTELGLEVKNLMDGIELDTLPSFLRQALMQLADFIVKGLADKHDTEFRHAHQI